MMPVAPTKNIANAAATARRAANHMALARAFCKEHGCTVTQLESAKTDVELAKLVDDPRANKEIAALERAAAAAKKKINLASKAAKTRGERAAKKAARKKAKAKR